MNENKNAKYIYITINNNKKYIYTTIIKKVIFIRALIIIYMYLDLHIYMHTYKQLCIV